MSARFLGPLSYAVTLLAFGWLAVAALAFALVACGYDMGTSPTRWAAPTASATPSPSPLPSFEEEVAAGKHWQYRNAEHYRSGVVEQWLQSSLGSTQGFRAVHAVRLTVKCNHRGDLLVGITGMGLFTTSERISVFYRTNNEVQEHHSVFLNGSNDSPVTGLDEGFIYQRAFGGGVRSPFYTALLSAREMTITTNDYAGDEMTVKWQVLGGLSQRIDELPCSIAP